MIFLARKLFYACSAIQILDCMVCDCRQGIYLRHLSVHVGYTRRRTNQSIEVRPAGEYCKYAKFGLPVALNPNPFSSTP
jgi:hypothetical protein